MFLIFEGSLMRALIEANLLETFESLTKQLSWPCLVNMKSSRLKETRTQIRVRFKLYSCLTIVHNLPLTLPRYLSVLY